MISEGTVVSPRGSGYPCTPNIWQQEAVDAWKPIVSAVKDMGATFFCQLWHCGRASHPHFQPDEALPIAPSALKITDGNQPFSLKTMQMEDYPVPRAMDLEDIKTAVEEFRVGARNAIAAGFDGVEVHGANGCAPFAPCTGQALQRPGKKSNMPASAPITEETKCAGG